MSFLRKWGGNSSGAQPSGSASNQAQELKREWYNETPGERYFGMENFGNTCYANSVLQSLYFSKPFRQLVEAYRPPHSISSSSNAPLASPVPSIASPPLPPSSPTSRLSAASSLRRPKSSTGNGPSTTGPPPPVPSTSVGTAANAGVNRKPSTRPGTSAGRATIANAFGHRRQESTNTTTSSLSSAQQSTRPEDDAASSNGAGEPGPGSPNPNPGTTFEGGAPLGPSQSMGSFTGVGTPVMGTGGQPVVAETTLLTTLHDLFCAISSQPKTTGTVAPQAFINQLKRDNEFFRSTLHQDAHEFLNYLVNMIAEAVEKEEKVRLEKLGAHLQRELDPDHPKTWVHTLFEGILTNETRCLTCETVTSRDEAFLDLSIDIEPNSSVTSCLRQFSANEMLCQRNKFSCDKCCGLQEAEKRMKIKKLPNILALHLKRFKYEESLQRHVKLTYRVVFPFELRLFNTADGVGNPDRLYELWAIVVHIGVGPHHGHYISIVKSGSRWIVFDDNSVFPIEEKDIQRYFGDTPGQGSGYVLFYQAVDLDVRSLSLRSEPRQRSETSSSISSTPLSSSYRPVALPEDIPPVPALPVELPPPQVSGLGLGLEPPEFAAPAPPPQSINGDPMSPPADAAHNLFNIPIPDQPDQFGPDQPLIPIPPTPLSSDTQTPLPATTPKSEKASLLSLSTNSNSASAPPKEKEGMWTLRGKKSVTSRIGRSLSLTANKEPARSVSSPTTGSASDFPSLPTIPSSASNGHLTNGGAPALFEPFTSTASQASGVAVPFTAEPETHAGLPTLPVSLSPHDASLNSTAHSTPTTSFPPPPSDDGSASTVSTGQGLHPGHSPQRRGSKASIDAGPSSNGPLATTRSLFSRKNSRPLSSSGSSGAGLGITSTTGRSGSLPNGTLDGLPPSSGPGLGDSQGATLHSSPSMILTKKEMEKKAKEERKEEERRAKERARIQKEDMKRAKEAEKIKKKLSLKM